MKNTTIAFLLLLLAGTLTAQTTTTFTGAGAAGFTGAAALNGVTLSSMRYGIGVNIVSDGTANGDFQSTLLGVQGRKITVSGKAVSGTVTLLGAPTVSGTCTVDLGDGSAPLTAVPFTLGATKGSDGKWALALTVGSTALPSAGVTAGSITVK